MGQPALRGDVSVPDCGRRGSGEVQAASDAYVLGECEGYPEQEIKDNAQYQDDYDGGALHLACSSSTYSCVILSG